MQKDILNILKKHIQDGVIDTTIEPTPKKITKSQIHNFGENMKGVNEFIGAAQTLSIHLSKIKNLGEKIDWIDELLKQESDKNTISMLETQKNTHITEITFMLENASFMGILLFDAQLSCIANKTFFNLNVENPLHHSPMLEYCNEQLEKINLLLSNINQKLNEIDENVDSVDYEKSLKENPFLKLL